MSALTTTATVLTPPSRKKTLDHAVVYNPNAAVIYLRISDSASEDGSNPNLIREPIPIGPGFSGTIYIGRMVAAAASITASTSSDGSGAPTSAVQASFEWSITG